jgi:putative intracellular protease/amidase
VSTMLQGGMPGAERLRDCFKLADLLAEQKASGRLYAAICAAPAVVLQAQGLLDGIVATSHPAFVDRLEDTRYGYPATLSAWVLTSANCVPGMDRHERSNDAKFAISLSRAIMALTSYFRLPAAGALEVLFLYSVCTA